MTCRNPVLSYRRGTIRRRLHLLGHRLDARIARHVGPFASDGAHRLGIERRGPRGASCTHAIRPLSFRFDPACTEPPPNSPTSFDTPTQEQQ
jgi:hypothetical protein